MWSETANEPPESCHDNLRVVKRNISAQEVQDPQDIEYSDGVIQGYDIANPGNGYKLTHEEGGSIFCRNFRIINEANRPNFFRSCRF